MLKFPDILLQAPGCASLLISHENRIDKERTAEARFDKTLDTGDTQRGISALDSTSPITGGISPFLKSSAVSFFSGRLKAGSTV